MHTRLEPRANDRGGSAARRGTALDPAQRPQPRRTRPYQRMADADRGTGGESLADFLGYFSLGLGLAEVLAPDAMSRAVGVRRPDDRNRATMRLMGLREIGHGLSVLSRQQPQTAMWSRVAGDAIDLAMLGGVLANPDNHRGRTLLATANVLVVSALDVLAARQLSRQPQTIVTERADQGIIRTRRSVTVRKPVEEVWAFWRDFTNFPRFMRHLESVTALDERRSHWVALAPAGRTVEWDAEITEERPNELLAWRALPDADVFNTGRVEFRRAPGDRGTEVHVLLEYDPPLGKLGSKAAMLFREEPGQQVQDSLRQFKQVMETGEVLLSDATKQRGPAPAHPNTRAADR